MPNTEKRSIARHQLTEKIHLEGGEDIVTGRTVDVSRNGMKVVVKDTGGLYDTSHVSVKLPGAEGDGIPCRVRRRQLGDGHWEFGLEFDGESDARMLLMERWLESLEKQTSETESAPKESRQVPRTRCTLEAIDCSSDNIEVISALDLSLDGMLLRVRGEVGKGDLLPLTMHLEGATHSISFTARAVYVAGSAENELSDVGVAVEEMRELDRNRLRSFIIDIASGAAMLEYQRLLERKEPSLEFQIPGLKALNLLRRLAEERQTMNFLDDGALRILETRIEKIEDEYLSIATPEPQTGDSVNKAFFSFVHDGSSFSFSTGRISWKDGLGIFEIPDCIYRGEKRAGHRRTADGNTVLVFQEGTGSKTATESSDSVRARILDSSRRGVLCEVDPAAFSGRIPGPGSILELISDEESVPGELRHIIRTVDANGAEIYRLGIETGIRRRPAETEIYNTERWANAWEAPERSLGDKDLVRPRPVEYSDAAGRRIAGLLHLNAPGKKCTAVVIPPAFGKKKEALGPLALTLMAHFCAAGENLAVLRYDGIDRPGESDNSNAHARRGYEMLGYRIDQGYEDLEASVRWIRNNNLFEVDKVAVISFSMAALDTRRLQSNPGVPKADYWISVMGVSSSQSALRNILGGLDVIANNRMGLPIGTMGMLGQLIDMDRMASDMIRLGYAVAADARAAMSQVNIPVTWIYGAHDKWMVPEEILDIMSIKARGDREVIEIPTAHNLRSSDDALKAFKMISDSILRRLRGREVPSVSPDKGEMLDLLTRERERIVTQENLDTKRYWKGYLVGEGANEEGYDFYRRLAEFREFLEVEVDLLDPKPGESIADLGCGTGLVSEAILNRLADIGPITGDLSSTRFTAVDLVEEAVGKAAEKYRSLSHSHPVLNEINDSWLSMDLEPDPLAALRRCIGNKDVSIEDLRDRIQGLNNDAVDRLAACPPASVTRYLLGTRLDNEVRAQTELLIGPGDILLLDDVNRAARFITGQLDEEDLKPARRRGHGPIGSDRLSSLRTSELLTAILDFGDATWEGKLPVEDGTFDAVSASLLLSYFFAPEEAVREFARMLRPGGRLLLSTMKPDSDISAIFTKYIAEQSTMDARTARDSEREKNLREARTMLNEAAALFSLEEDGWFRFFDENELVSMMHDAGFTDIRCRESLGIPGQAVIVCGIKSASGKTN